ncbi:hypothetical protein Tco_0942980 [Tanacetum coccineum]
MATNRFTLIVLSALRRSDKENKQVRSVLTEPEMEMKIPHSSNVKFITACSYSIDEYNDMMKAQIYVVQDFRYSDTQKVRILQKSQENGQNRTNMDTGTDRVHKSREFLAIGQNKSTLVNKVNIA